MVNISLTSVMRAFEINEGSEASNMFMLFKPLFR